MGRRRFIAASAFVWCSAALAVSYRIVGDNITWRPEAIGPDVPYLLLPRGTQTDVVSSVSYFVWILGVAWLCCFPVELAKLLSRSLPRPVCGYVSLVLFQLLVFADVLRTYAYDWWRYVLWILGIRDIHSTSWMITSVARLPWLTCVAAVAVTALLYAHSRAADGSVRRVPENR